MKFPSELSDINGFNDFHIKVNPSIFISNLQVFKKYTDDDFVQCKIDYLHKLHTNANHQKNTIQDLEIKYKALVSRLYRIRNGLVHNALIGKNDIFIYVEWLRYCVVLILNASVLIDENKIGKDQWNYEYALKIFKPELFTASC